MKQSPKLRLYTDLHYRAGCNNQSMMPVVWAQLDKISEAERIKKHHARATHFELVSDIEQADWCVLPDIWSEYVKQKKVTLAKAFADLASANGKLVLVWSGGDPEWIIPIKNAILVQEGLYRGIARQPAFAFERPGFVTDYVQMSYNKEWRPIPKKEKPTIGFCGQAASKLRSRINFYVRNSITTMGYHTGVSPIIPNLHGYSVDLRAKTLQILSESKNIETNFIIRNQYKAGVFSGIQMTSEQSRLDFINNMMGNMYTVCMRGGGNFSKRFYETLCCGRIPILVDTDNMLPFEEFIDWDRYIIRIKKNDLPKIGKIVNDFHSSLSSDDLEEIQLNCRKLWLEQLTTSGYYSHFHRYLSITNAST